MGYITELDAQSESSHTETYFINDNLKQLEFSDAKQFKDFLQSRAFMEGFRLSHKKSLKEKSITFRFDKSNLNVSMFESNILSAQILTFLMLTHNINFIPSL